MKPFRFAWNGQIFSKEDTYWILGTITAVVLTGLVVLFCLILSGCQPQQRADLTPDTDESKLEALRLEKILEAIHKTGRLVTAFIIVIVVGVFLCKVALAWGLLTIFAGGIGVAAVRADQVIATNLATNPYFIKNPWWILVPIGMALIAGGFWFFKNEQVRTALKEIVWGIDNIKTGGSKEAYQEFKEWQGQSDPTKKIVREIKAKR